MLGSRIGKEERKEKEKEEIIIRRVYGQRMDLICRCFGRCHLHCAPSSLTPPSTFVPRT